MEKPMSTPHDNVQAVTGLDRFPARVGARLRPEVAEFLEVLAPYVAESTIVVTGPDIVACGLPELDVLLVDGGEAVGIAVGPDMGGLRDVPAGLVACYNLDAVDLASRSEDSLYLLSRWHSSLFREDASMRLARLASDAALVTAAGTPGQWVQLRARHSSEAPALIGRLVAARHKSTVHRLEAA
jgi:hypothetical protein